MKKIPVIFISHGSTMNATSDNEFTSKWRSLGKALEKPEGILLISAHWYTDGIKANNEEAPRRIYDMYGFPEEFL